MPRYFFDVSDGDADKTGVVLQNVAEALGRARRLVANLVETTPVGIGEYKSLSCIVRNAEDEPVLRIVIAALVEDARAPRGEVTRYQPV